MVIIKIPDNPYERLRLRPKFSRVQELCDTFFFVVQYFALKMVKEDSARNTLHLRAIRQCCNDGLLNRHAQAKKWVYTLLQITCIAPLSMSVIKSISIATL